MAPKTHPRPRPSTPIQPTPQPHPPPPPAPVRAAAPLVEEGSTGESSESSSEASSEEVSDEGYETSDARSNGYPEPPSVPPGSAQVGSAGEPHSSHYLRAPGAGRVAGPVTAGKFFSEVDGNGSSKRCSPSTMPGVGCVEEVKGSLDGPEVGGVGAGSAPIDGSKFVQNLPRDAREVFDELSQRESTHETASRRTRKAMGRSKEASTAPTQLQEVSHVSPPPPSSSASLGVPAVPAESVAGLGSAGAVLRHIARAKSKTLAFSRLMHYVGGVEGARGFQESGEAAGLEAGCGNYGGEKTAQNLGEHAYSGAAQGRNYLMAREGCNWCCHCA